MADGNRECVRGVSLGNFRQAQQCSDHLLHLLFFGFSLADNCLFYLQRGVLRDRQTAMYRRDNSGSASLPQFEGALGVGRKKYILDGDLIWPITGNNFQ